MKRFVIICLVGFVLGITPYLYSQARLGVLPDCSNLDCGKIVGSILDAETKEKVNEPFYIAFTDCNVTDKVKIAEQKHFLYIIESAKDGDFSVYLSEGRYCLQFWPIDFESKYCPDPTPSLNPSYFQMVEVKKGHISTMQKLAETGGYLKILLVDKNTSKINPKAIFGKRVHVHAKIESDRVTPAIIRAWEYSDKDGLNDGEAILMSMPSEMYNVNIEFSGMGYGSQMYKDIEIEKDKTNEMKVVINFNDQTGISGKITDTDDNPLSGLLVSADSVKDAEIVLFNDYGSVYTDKNGRYKIIGLKEQTYSLQVSGKINGKKISSNFGAFEIKKGIILNKTLKIDIAK